MDVLKETFISGYPKNQTTFARVTGYCEQNDIHSPNVTVYESLLYSAWLRLPSDVNTRTRKMFVNELMELMELKPIKDALVGFPGVNGLSIEQRKSLTIAVELVANPSIIFLDEPTSGLDARAAAIVMRTIRNTMDTRRTVGKTTRSVEHIGSFIRCHFNISLVYLTTCLIGHQVEVQVIDGYVFSGIFHAANAEKDFGIILKMARVTKVGSSRGQKIISGSVQKPPSKTLIIPAKELVQIVAKSVSVTRDGLMNELQHYQLQDIMIDSSISQSRHVDLERELEPWVPDGDNLPDLDNTFDRHWNRGWDQLEVNATLFGVKSTFNEELYTTKLHCCDDQRV